MRLAYISALIASMVSLGLTTACFAVDTPYSVTLSGDLSNLHALSQRPAKAGDRFKVIRLSTRVPSLGRLHFVFNSQKLPAASAVVVRNRRDEKDLVVPTLLKGYVWRNRGGLTDAHRERAALAVIKGALRIQFISPHQPRSNLYAISTKLKASSVLKATLSRTHQSMFLKHDCGDRDDGLRKEFALATSRAGVQSKFVASQRVVTISTDADPEWYGVYGEAGNAEIAAIVNAAEAIFERQLGVRFVLVKQHQYMDAATSPYVSTDPSKLLLSFAKNPENPRNLGISTSTFNDDVDVRYLFSGKDLNGNTIGLSYVGALCWSSKDAYGLVQNTRPAINITTFLHELGHTFGARHDEADPLSIMYPTLGVKSYFSPASIAEMSGHMGYFGKCISEQLLSPNLSNAVLTLKSSRSKDRRKILIKGTFTANSGARISNEVVRLTLNDRRIATLLTNKNGVFKLPLSISKLKSRSLTVVAQTAESNLANPPVLRIKI
jgi:hypothetical protein